MDDGLWAEIAGVAQALVFFTFLAAVIIGPRYLRSRDRDKLHETLRIAYEKGQPVPPELIDALVNEPKEQRQRELLPTPDRDFRRGLVLVFIGVVRDEIAISHPEFHRREMMLIGSRNAVKADFDHVTASILAGHVPVAALVTHRTTLEGAVTDLPLWAQQKSGLIKAIIQIG